MKIFIEVGALVLLLLIFLILGILWWKGCWGGRISREGTHFTLILCANLDVEIKRIVFIFSNYGRKLEQCIICFCKGSCIFYKVCFRRIVFMYFLQGIMDKCLRIITAFLYMDNGWWSEWFSSNYDDKWAMESCKKLISLILFIFLSCW